MENFGVPFILAGGSLFGFVIGVYATLAFVNPTVKRLKYALSASRIEAERNKGHSASMERLATHMSRLDYDQVKRSLSRAEQLNRNYAELEKATKA